MSREAQRRFRERHPERAAIAMRKMRANKRKIVNDHKTSVGCRCGERHPACLDLHHRDKTTKNIRLMERGRGWHILSYAQIEAELKLCDVLCANCHRKEHWQERQ